MKKIRFVQVRRFVAGLVCVCAVSFGCPVLAQTPGGQCQPSGAYCNNIAGSQVFQNVPGTCPTGTQVAMSVCEALVPRVGFQQAGTSDIRPGQQWTVRAVGGTQRTVVTRRDPRYPGLVQRLEIDETNIDTLGHNAEVDRARLELYNQQSIGRDLILANNDRVLAQRIENNRGQVTFQVNDLREEWRLGVAPAVRYTYQPGGSPTFGLGLGFTLSHWAQGSDFGIEGDVAFYGLQSQPLVPGRTPLFGASAGIHGIYGRGVAQLLFGASGGMGFRFGEAQAGEVTGGTAFNLGLGGGVRLEIPLRPVSRPSGARFFGQFMLHGGFGGVNALVNGQDPLHMGFVLDLQAQTGFRF